VKDNAWGHHASCSCRIGKEADGGVLDSQFRVHGVKGLRVVDASIFPRIPGFFIVSSIYIAAEKAADVIHNERD
jgi:choline dehydrogenase